MEDGNWKVLSSLLPAGWREMAVETKALKGLRSGKDADSALRVLLLHAGCGHSLRETAALARESGLAELSDVATMKRLRKSEEWLRRMCVALFRENGGEAPSADCRMRAFDATLVKEPGRGRCGGFTTGWGCRRWSATTSS